MAIFKVALGQPDAHWQDGAALNASTFDPIQRRGLAFFMQRMLDRCRCRVGKSRNGSNDSKLKSKHLEMRREGWQSFEWKWARSSFKLRALDPSLHREYILQGHGTHGAYCLSGESMSGRSGLDGMIPIVGELERS